MMVQGIMKFILLADDSTQVPNLQKKCYANYRAHTHWMDKFGLAPPNTQGIDISWSHTVSF